MTDEAVRRLISDMEEAVPLPRRNGEPVFEAPWESRAFAMALSLSMQGTFQWEEFRQQLMAEIAVWQEAPGPEEWSYYERWVTAVENLLDRKKILATTEIFAASRDLGSDHEHSPHDHDH